MPGPAPSVYSPFIRWGMPQANSATSTPRWMSPLASGIVLPCSRARSSASESISLAIKSRNFIITRARRCGLVAPQAGCAAFAVSTARRTSSLEASATLRDDVARHRLKHITEAARMTGDRPSPHKMTNGAQHPSPNV